MKILDLAFKDLTQILRDKKSLIFRCHADRLFIRGLRLSSGGRGLSGGSA
jgi:hypothetical protein